MIVLASWGDFLGSKLEFWRPGFSHPVWFNNGFSQESWGLQETLLCRVGCSDDDDLEIPYHYQVCPTPDGMPVSSFGLGSQAPSSPKPHPMES